MNLLSFFFQVQYMTETSFFSFLPQLSMAKLQLTPVLCELMALPDIDCKRYGIMTLSNLAANAETRQVATKSGGLQSAVLLTKDKDVDCRRYAAICLGNMANHHGTQAQVVIHGALGSVLEMASSSDIESQRHAVMLLGNLAVNENNHTPLMQKGTLGILLELTQSREADIREYAAYAIANFCSNYELLHAVGRQGGIQPLISIAGSNNVHAQCLGLAALR